MSENMDVEDDKHSSIRRDSLESRPSVDILSRDCLWSDYSRSRSLIILLRDSVYGNKSSRVKRAAIHYP